MLLRTDPILRAAPQAEQPGTFRRTILSSAEAKAAKAASQKHAAMMMRTFFTLPPAVFFVHHSADRFKNAMTIYN